MRYGEQGSRKALIVSGSAITAVTIFGLTHNTHYTVEVAAVNNVGTGHYSNPITLITDGKGTVMELISCELSTVILCACFQFKVMLANAPVMVI